MISPGKPSCTLKEIREYISDLAVASYYLNIRNIPTKINSPLRRDERPSLGIYSPDGTSVYFKDFGTGESGSIYTLLMKMWNTDFKGMCERIYKDMESGFSKPSKRKCTYRQPKVSPKSEIKVKVRNWEKHDIDYWQSYGVPVEWLKYAEVYPISHKIVLKGDDRMVYGADKYAYAYVEHKDNKTTLKIYQPFNKLGFKWSSKHDKSVISLWTKVPEKGEILCICSSLKDALCLWANTGIPAVATQGEGYSISETAVKSLKERYEKVYILFDNDEAGITDGKKLSKTTGFINLELPRINGAKDISDLYKSLTNKSKFKQIILNLFANGNS